MNFNIFPMLLNIQENTSSILDGVPSLVETEQISMWQLIWGYDSVSGEYSLTSLIVMSLLFLFSFIAIYVFIERFMTIQRALKGEKDFIKKINDFVLKGNLIEAKEHCNSSNNPIARMLEKGISRVGKPMKDIAISFIGLPTLLIPFSSILAIGLLLELQCSLASIKFPFKTKSLIFFIKSFSPFNALCIVMKRSIKT